MYLFIFLSRFKDVWFSACLDFNIFLIFKPREGKTLFEKVLFSCFIDVTIFLGVLVGLKFMKGVFDCSNWGRVVIVALE